MRALGTRPRSRGAVPSHAAAALALAAAAAVSAQPFDYAAPRPPLYYANESAKYYSGVAQLRGLGLDCTGWLAALGAPGDNATMLTAGHCLGALDATTVFEDVAPRERSTATFLKFIDVPDALDVPVERILWGSMRHFDVAVLRLAATNAELAARGLRSYNISGDLAAGGAVRTAGLPVGADPRVLRETNCTAGPIVRINERFWIWNSARRLGGAECGGILPGSSGSPLFNAAGGAVGVVTTTTIAADPSAVCYSGNPCELVPGTNQTSLPNTTYAMELAPLLPCFAGGRFDRSAQGCPLEPAATAVRVPGYSAQPNITVWTVRADADAAAVPQVAWKHGLLADTDCLYPSGYATVLPAGAAYNATLPSSAEARWVACAAPSSPDGPATANAGHRILKIDRTPPTVPIVLDVSTGGRDGVSMMPLYRVPELSLFEWKWGSPKATNCSSLEGLVPYRNTFANVPGEELPVLVCVRGADEAGNWGAPAAFPIGRNGTITTTTTRPSGAGGRAGWRPAVLGAVAAVALLL